MTCQPKCRRTLLICAFLLSGAVLGCADDPVSVDGVAVFARGGGGAVVSVDATDPSSAEQGAENLTVTVTGSGFEPFSEVSFLLDRKVTADITTNSTNVISDTQAEVDITVSAIAAPELFDVRLTTPRGRKGIGIELFEVSGTHPGCSLEFDLTIEAGQLHSDAGGDYRNGVDKVIVFTGTQGDGFRFATPAKGKGKNDPRRVKLDFTGTPWEALLVAPDELISIDLRFSNQDPGLNLCAINGSSNSVAVNIAFESSGFESGSGGLKYGGTTFLGESCGSQLANVERTSETEWKMSGTTACIATGGSIVGDPFTMPFAFTLTAQ